MNTKPSTTVQALIHAPVAKVWDLYTKPEHITHWNNASPDWHSPKAENNLVVGGKFNYRMEAKDGSAGFDFWGTYTDVKEHALIAYTMGDDRQATVNFDADDNKTKVTVTFEAENENSIDMQRDGWQAILDNFKIHVEAH